MRFTKVNGLGNDYCVFDAEGRADWTDERWGDLARAISDRETGVGSDGILVLGAGEALEECITVASMRVYNADGSRGEMCGNGLRCVGRLLVERGRARAGGSMGFVISTDAGLRTVWVDPADPAAVRTTMGTATFGPEAVGAIPERLSEIEGVRLADVGNPHAIVVVDSALNAAELANRGLTIENSRAFPDRINAQFVKITSRNAVSVQSWERGSGATSACGTGAAAAVAALNQDGLVDREVVVSLPGGDLLIEIGSGGEILQTGPAEIEFVGDWEAG